MEKVVVRELIHPALLSPPPDLTFATKERYSGLYLECSGRRGCNGRAGGLGRQTCNVREISSLPLLAKTNPLSYLLFQVVGRLQHYSR